MCLDDKQEDQIEEVSDLLNMAALKGSEVFLHVRSPNVKRRSLMNRQQTSNAFASRKTSMRNWRDFVS